MQDILSVAVVDRLNEALHVFGCLLLSEDLVLLLDDLFEEGHAADVLHDEVNEQRVVVRLVVLDDVRVVQLVQRRDLRHDVIKLTPELLLVHDFNRHFDAWVVLITGQEDLAKAACPENLGL